MSWLPDILDGDPHHFTWVLDAEADTARFYLDGIERGFWLRYTPPGEPSPIWTGETINGRVGIVSPTNFNALDLADGVADEFRLVAGVRGPDWVQTEFLNQSDPFAFYDIAAAEEYNGGPTSAGNPLAGLNSLGQLRVAPNPFYGIAYVSVETPLTDVTLQVFDLRGRLVRTLGQPARGGENMLRFLWNGRDESGTEVGQGVYFLRATSGSAVATGKAMLVR